MNSEPEFLLTQPPWGAPVSWTTARTPFIDSLSLLVSVGAQQPAAFLVAGMKAFSFSCLQLYSGDGEGKCQKGKKQLPIKHFMGKDFEYSGGIFRQFFFSQKDWPQLQDGSQRRLERILYN